MQLSTRFDSITGKLTAFWLFLALVFCRYTFFPEAISGLSTFESALLHTALNGGLFIAVMGTFVTLSGRFEMRHFYWSIGLTAFFYQINLLTLCVYGYILIFQGEIGLPHEPFPVTKHNMYLTYFFALAAVCLFCLSKQRNVFRTLFVFPVLILGLGLTYYHTYQFFLYSQDTLDSLRHESAEYWTKNIDGAEFHQLCESIENVKCAEFRDGDPWPEHIMIESSPVLFGLRKDYLESQFRVVQGVVLEYNNFRSSRENGQIDDTQSDSFWATITFRRVNGLNRIVVHDFIGDVHKASFSAGIAFLVIALLWGSLSIFAMQKHTRFKKLVSEDPGAPWYAAIMLPAIFFVSNLEALQDRFHWYALFLLVFCGGWRFLGRPRFWLIALPVSAVITLITLATFKPEWVNITVAGISAVLVSGALYAYLLREELTYREARIPILMFLAILDAAAVYYLLDGSLFLAVIPGLGLMGAIVGISAYAKKGARLNTLFAYFSLLIISVMSLAFMFGVNPYNLAFINQSLGQSFVSSPDVVANIEGKVYGYYVFTVSCLTLFISLILSKIIPLHRAIKYS